MPDLEEQVRLYGAVLDRRDFGLGDVTEALPRRAPRSYVVAIAAAVVIAIVVSALVVARRGDAPPPHVVTPGRTVPAPIPMPFGVLAIGDSVMEGADGALRSAMPGIAVDAVPSRQMGQAVDVLRQYKVLDVLPGTVVIALATNGPTTATQLDAVMRAAGTRQVFFIEARVPRVWERPNNALLSELPRRWANAHVIDWKDYSAAHDDWFVADGFHLTKAGQYAYSAFIASSLRRPPVATSPGSNGLDVVAVLVRRALPPQPLAVAGGEVWTATQAVTSSLFVRLEGHDPATAKLRDTIDVPQEAVFGIAGDGDTLWVAGGGDGGVPQTTVSKVDVRTKSVVFTKTLTGTPCSCTIVAGDAGVWLTGNGSDHTLHLSEADGHVVASVALPAPVPLSAAMETRGRLLVGLHGGTVAVVDPATNRVEHFVDLGGLASGDSVIAMSPATIPSIGSDPPIDGLMAASGSGVFALLSDRWQANQFAQADFNPQALAASGSRVIVAGGDWLKIATTHAVVSNEFAYEPGPRRFVRIAEGPASAAGGFRNAVTVGDMLWMVNDPGAGVDSSIVVTRIPESFQFR